MNSNWKVNQSQYGKDRSLIRSTRGYILDNHYDTKENGNTKIDTKQMTEKTNFNLIIEKNQYISAGEDVTDPKKSLLNCGSMDVKNNAKYRNKCLKNQIQSNLNKEDELENEDNNSISCSNVETPKYLKKNQKNINRCDKNDLSCKYNTYQDHAVDNDKYKIYNEGARGRRNNTTNSYCTYKKQKVSKQPQKDLVDHIKYYEKLNELNNEITKIQELFTNIKEVIPCIDVHNNTINVPKDISATGDLTEHDGLGKSEQKKAASVQTSDIYEHGYANEYNNTLEYNDAEECNNVEEYYKYDDEFWESNEQMEFIEQGIQKTPEGFYQDENSIVHFFEWSNPHECQCGMINNNN